MFPKVQKGQRFQPSASMHNAVVDLLNKTNGMLAGEQKSGKSNMVRIAVKNNTGTILESGVPVAVSGCSMNDMIFEVRKVQRTDTVIAVVVNAIEPDKVGSAVLVGVAVVKVKGEQRPFVLPKYDTYEWQYQPTGGFPVLCKVGATSVILVAPGLSTGGGHDLFWASYDTEKKKILVTGGYGDWFEPQRVTELEPKEGIICLCAKADEARGKYKQPEIDYAEPSTANYPLAKVMVANETNGKGETEQIVSIVNYGVSTAGIVETANCPLASAASSVGA
ncbi:MAG: hypothetical protein IKB77_04625 [Lentisphaeria bacterium]|nr:hypothetical protein [Lentisphaeria bacterium]